MYKHLEAFARDHQKIKPSLGAIRQSFQMLQELFKFSMFNLTIHTC